MGNFDDLREAMARLASSASELARLFREMGGTLQTAADEAAQDFQKARAEFLQALGCYYDQSLQEIVDQLADLAADPPPPKKKPPRPPRYAGPQNKGRTWNRQPPRLARSCCRKMRR